MSQTAFSRMNAEAFFAWQETQDALYELVDGYPLRMMSGAENRHDDITVNLIVAIDAKLTGKPCRPSTQDTAIKISDTQIRRPDMAINCGPSRSKTFYAIDPRAVFEILSRSTRNFDLTKKLEEYKCVASLTHIVLIDPDTPEVIAFQRAAGESWASRTFAGIESALEFADLGFVLTLAEIYRGLEFRARPMLVAGELADGG